MNSTTKPADTIKAAGGDKKAAVPKFGSYDVLIAGVRKEREQRVGELEALQSIYVGMMGGEDPNIAQRIRDTVSRYDAKLSALEGMHARFVEVMRPSDARLSIQNSNSHVDFESDELYARVRDEPIRQRIRNRSLDESGYLSTIFAIEVASAAGAASREAPARPEAQAPRMAGEAEAAEIEEEAETAEDEEAEIKPSPLAVLLRAMPRREWNSFKYFALEDPEVREKLKKGELDDLEKIAILKRYARSRKEMVASLKAKAAELAPVLGITRAEARKYLEYYRPEQLRELAMAALREGFKPGKLIAIDLMLLEDGFYPGRLQDAMLVCSFRARACAAIAQAYGMCEVGTEAGEQEAELAALWNEVLSRHNGDAEKAEAEFNEKAAELMTSGGKRERAPYEIGMSQAFEFFKLFEYDRDVMQDFAEYFCENFTLHPEDEFKTPDELRDRKHKAPHALKVPGIVLHVLKCFVAERGENLVLNERSRYYSAVEDIYREAQEEAHGEDKEREEVSLWDDDADKEQRARFKKPFFRSGAGSKEGSESN